MGKIEVGQMVFLAEGREGIGAVREVSNNGFSLYVENAGDFTIPQSAVVSVHDGKVLVNPKALDARLIEALKHTHDAEDPKLVG